jgi:L-lactate dehydrogenase
MVKVSFDGLVDFGTRLLVGKGVGEEDARYMAEIAATAEACGIHTHGVTVFGYFDRTIGEGIDVAATPQVVRERGATALIDAKRSFAQMAMRLASDLAHRKAREHGIAMIGVRNTSWMGALSTYLLPLVTEGLFAQLWAQSCACKDSAPYGGTEPRFSTNPLALAFPTAEGAMIADFSTSAFSMGKVGVMIREGRRSAEPAFFGPDGKLTDDPSVMRDGGAMLLMGGLMNGYKGYALALWCEALTAMAGGSCNNPELEQRQCFNLTVIDPEAFEGMDYYRTEMARYVGHIKSSRRMEGVTEIRLPGERMFDRLAASKADGVDLPESLLKTLNDVAERNNLEPIRAMA